MNKKIKVIELINRVYENKDVPKKVKYDDEVYSWDANGQDYERFKRTEEDGITHDGWLFQETPKYWDGWLEQKVEILEDEEEIDIQNIEELQTFSDSTVYDYNDIDRNRRVINDLVKAVKQLDKKINKE